MVLVLVIRRDKLSAVQESVLSDTIHAYQNPDIRYSNQWFMPLAAPISQPIYALPLTYRVNGQTFYISYPSIQVTPDTVFAPHRDDVAIDFGEDIVPSITGIGRFTVSTELTPDVTVAIGHGIPYAVFNSSRDADISASSSVINVINPSTATISVGQATYIVMTDTAKAIESDGSMLHLEAPGWFLVGVLPDDYDPSVFDTFTALRGLTIDGSDVISYKQDDEWVVKYTLMTNNHVPLIALYPHQYRRLRLPAAAIGTYQTVRGSLMLTSSSSFETYLPDRAIPESFARYDMPDWFDEALSLDVNHYLAQSAPPGVYFKGVWLGVGTSLLDLTHSYGSPALENELGNKLSKELSDGLGTITYDPHKQSMVAANTEFGNDELNDHLFHYGYYIRAGATLLRLGYSLSQQDIEKVDLLVRDVATIDPHDAKFPLVRGFDWYESHSWADGQGDTPDGNNQESTSEAVQGWYGVYLWASVRNNAKLADGARLLYLMEIEGARTYWFNTEALYPSGYNHAIASLVWGGKIDFLTWFSPEANMKYGIELLPYTPASSYLDTFTKQQIALYKKDWRDHGGSFEKDWGNLMRVWFAGYEAANVSADDVKSYTDTSGHMPFSLYAYALMRGN